MNFKKDLREIAEKHLSNYGVSFNSNEDDRIVIDRWINVEIRIIQKKKRVIRISKKIENSSYNEDINAALDLLKKKIENGDDINSYLSKSIFYEDYTDYLFSDWGIHHLHLSIESDPNDSKFMKRSDKLLFVTYNEEEIYFIDIRPHNEQYVFAQKELLEIIESDFPQVIESYRIKDAIDVAIDIEDAPTIKAMREAGYNMLYKVNGKIYAPMGGGFTAATLNTKSVRVRMISNDFIRMIRNYEKHIIENKTKIEDMIKKINPTQNCYNYKLIFTDAGYKVLETNSGILL
jgi:hypothetical protein